MRTAALTLATLLAAAAAPAQKLAREGPYFVESVTGSEVVPDTARLRIVFNGDVTLGAGKSGGISWVLKARVRARNEAEARNRLRGAEVRASRRGNAVTLTAAPGAGEATLLVTVPALRETALNLAHGDVETSDFAGVLNVLTGSGRIRADRVRGDVVLRTAGGDILLGSVSGTARCSTGGGSIQAGSIGGEAMLENGAGDIVAGQVGGLVRAVTSGGAIHVAQASGGVIASTGGGRIDVGQAGGLVELRNSGGAVRVGAAEGVRCENAAGTIHLSNVTGRLRASTSAGSIIAQVLAGKPLGESFLTTGRGDITVVLPSNVGVKIHAENETSGGTSRIVSEFPGIQLRKDDTALIADGEINGGGALLRISASGGTIFIKRQ